MLILFLKAPRLVVLVAIWFCCPIAQATTVVALRTSSEIIIAADSKRGLGKDLDPVPSCKITQIGAVVIVGAGFVELTGTNYNIRNVAARAFGESDNKFTDRVDKFSHYMARWLRDTLVAMRTMPETHLDDSEVSQERAEIIMAAVENGIPMMVRMDFVPKVFPDGSIRVGIARWSCPTNCEGSITRYGIGIHPNIDAFVALHPNVLESLSLPESARFLVLLEAVNFPAYVGEPVDIVRLDKTGVHWIQRKPECKEKPTRDTNKRRAKNR